MSASDRYFPTAADRSGGCYDQRNAHVSGSECRCESLGIMGQPRRSSLLHQNHHLGPCAVGPIFGSFAAWSTSPINISQYQLQNHGALQHQCPHLDLPWPFSPSDSLPPTTLHNHYRWTPHAPHGPLPTAPSVYTLDYQHYRRSANNALPIYDSATIYSLHHYA